MISVYQWLRAAGWVWWPGTYLRYNKSERCLKKVWEILTASFVNGCTRMLSLIVSSSSIAVLYEMLEPQVPTIHAQIREHRRERFWRTPYFIGPCKIKSHSHCGTRSEALNIFDSPTGWGPIGSVLTRKSGTAMNAPSRLSRRTASRSSRAAWCSSALRWWKYMSSRCANVTS